MDRAADGVPWVSSNRMEFIIPAIFDDTHHLSGQSLQTSLYCRTSPTFKKQEKQSVVVILKVSTSGCRKQELKTPPGGLIMKLQIFLREIQNKEIRRRNLINLFWQRFRESLSFRQCWTNPDCFSQLIYCTLFHIRILHRLFMDCNTPKKMSSSDLSRNRLRSCTAASLTVTHQHLGNAASSSHSSKRAKSLSCSCHGWSRQDDSADMETGHNQSTFTSLLLHNWCCGARVFP